MHSSEDGRLQQIGHKPLPPGENIQSPKERMKYICEKQPAKVIVVFTGEDYQHFRHDDCTETHFLQTGSGETSTWERGSSVPGR